MWKRSSGGRERRGEEEGEGEEEVGGARGSCDEFIVIVECGDLLCHFCYVVENLDTILKI